jgi:ribosomal protein S8E
VAIKFASNNIALAVTDLINQKAIINVYPNPSSSSFNFSFNVIDKAAAIEIYTINGQSIDRLTIQPGETSVIWNTEKIPEGIYFAKFIVGSTVAGIKKLVLIK